MFDLDFMSDQLLDARDRKGVTRQQAADDIGIHKNSLGRLEQGVQAPRADTMVIIANYYGKSVQHLFFKNQGRKRTKQ